MTAVLVFPGTQTDSGGQWAVGSVSDQRKGRTFAKNHCQCQQAIRRIFHKSSGKLVTPLGSPVLAYSEDMGRTLHLIAYDVCDPKRLHRVCRYLTGYKVGGQKSVFEVWVTPGELRQIERQLEMLMKPEEDRLHILALDPRMKPRCLGQGNSFSTGHFAIV